jgi:hypothetical protein
MSDVSVTIIIFAACISMILRGHIADDILIQLRRIADALEKDKK